MSLERRIFPAEVPLDTNRSIEGCPIALQITRKTGRPWGTVSILLSLTHSWIPNLLLGSDVMGSIRQ